VNAQLHCESRSVAVPVCRFEDMPIGIGIAVDVGAHSIAVFRTRTGAVYAVENRCPHRGGPLADGIIAGSQIVCPLHALRFSLHDGQCEADNTCTVSAYPTRITNGWVSVEVPPAPRCTLGEPAFSSQSLGQGEGPE
jgi:nitrite reductase (NADH) small subunit